MRVKEGWITAMLYYLTNRYCNNKNVQKGYQSINMEEPETMKALHRKDGEPGEEGDLYVPTMLHFDKKAYENLVTLNNRLDATNQRLTDQKRHKYKKVDSLKNPLSGQISEK